MRPGSDEDGMKLLQKRLVWLFVLLLVTEGVVAAEPLPKDVSSFIEQREACDHWRGEYGDDEERQAEIDMAVCETCVGTDKRLATLKRKYKAKQGIITRLNEFEADIEPDDHAANTAFCQRARSKYQK